MDVLPKTFLQIILTSKWLVQHSSIGPSTSSDDLLPSLLSDSYSMVVANDIWRPGTGPESSVILLFNLFHAQKMRYVYTLTDDRLPQYRCICRCIQQVYRCKGVQVYIQVYRCIGVQVYRCIGVQVYRRIGVQVYRDFLLYKYETRYATNRWTRLSLIEDN